MVRHEETGKPFTLIIKVGTWYTGKSANFSSEYYDVNARTTTTMNNPFYEISTGEYGLDLTFTQDGVYLVRVSNIDIYTSHLSIMVKSSVTSIPPTLTNDIAFISNILNGKWDFVGNRQTIYAPDQITPVAAYDLFDANGVPVTIPGLAYIRVPVKVP